MSFEPEILLGPPGTGKTTRLLQIVAEALASGVQPTQIGFVAFTRKAATEAVERACTQFNLHKKQLPYFRTLHSFAMGMTGIPRDALMSSYNYQDLSNIIGVPMNGGIVNDAGHFLAGNLTGDKALFVSNLSRIKNTQLIKEWAEQNEYLKYELVDYVHNSLKKYKRKNSLYDFTDLLEEFVLRGHTPQLKLLVVDEAQDLSRLQWLMVEKLAANAEHTIVAGDDDQAIYDWAGADVNYFLNLKGPTTTLGQSYRVPKAVQGAAFNLLRRIRSRRQKEWAPRDEQGQVEQLMGGESLDFTSGEWLVLSRNNETRAVEELKYDVRRQGVLYTERGRKSVSAKLVKAIQAYTTLSRGGEVTPSDAKEAAKWITNTNVTFPKEARVTPALFKETVKCDLSTIWHEAFRLLDQETKSYLIAVLRRKESITAEPRVKFSTIHGSKGGEAQNVVIATDVSKASNLNLERNPDSENRVFYVGATRAKENLYILFQRTTCFFPLLV